MDWERMPASRWGLRQLGVVLLFAAYAAGKHLLAIGSGNHGDQPPIVYFLALIAFLCGSAGSALLVHGHHLFDKVQVSERWQRRPSAAPEMTPVVPPEEQPTKADAVPEIVWPSDASSGQAPMPEKPRTFRVL